MATVSKVMRRLGYASFVMAGSGTPPIVERILAIHRSLYRPSDLAVGRIHGGIFMFRDLFARISIPFGYGQMSEWVVLALNIGEYPWITRHFEQNLNGSRKRHDRTF